MFWRKRNPNDFAAEIHAHLELETEQLKEQGLSEEEARMAARRAFGSVTRAQERFHESGRWLWCDHLVQDLRFGLRMMAKNPGFTAVAVITLALGMGANTAMFSVVEAVLLRPLPYKNPDRLTVIWQSDPEHRRTGAWFDTYREFDEWSRYSRSFEKLAALTWASPGYTLSWKGQRQDVLAIPTSVDFFSMLGVRAVRGRTFEAGDLRAPCAVVLAYGFWQDRLGGAPGLVGSNLVLNNQPCTVVGIMPKDFSFYPKQTGLWILITSSSAFAKHPRESQVGVFGLLKNGVSRSSAEAELATLQNRIISEAPTDSVLRSSSPVALDLQFEFTWLTGRNLRASLMVLFGAVAMVLLIAAVNIASLLLARAGERQRELALRAALGSGRSRLIRQLLTESVLLSVGGGLLGALLAVAGIRFLNATNPVELPPGNPVAVNWAVLAFTAGLAVLTGLVFGLVPAWKASQLDLNEVIKESSQSVARGALTHGAGKALVILEVALSMVLLAAAGLLIQSVARLSSAPLGFQPDCLLTASIALPSTDYPKPERRLGFFERLLHDVSALPGVEGAALSPPFASGGHALTVEGRTAMPGALPYDVSEQSVSAGYFGVMRIPVLRGREFDTRDRENSLPVAVISNALAKEYFPKEDPIGRQIKLGKPEENIPWLTVVGVVGDVKSTTVFKEMGYVVQANVYRPLKQETPSWVSVFVRTAGAPLALVPSVRHALSDIDRNLPPPEPETMNHWLSQFLVQPRLRAILLGSFAALALLLAAIGIYGVLSQLVVQRTHEIGIRMALGAERRDVLWMTVGQSMTLVLAGAGIGLGAALGLTRFLASMLYDVKPTDAATIPAACAVLLVVGLIASYLPTRRATKIDPMVALKYE
jgi:predicted permease